MKKHHLIPMIALILGASLLLAACSSGSQTTEAPVVETKEVASQTEAPAEQPAVTESPEATEAPVPELFGDTLRGGLLYDKWWSVLGVDAPTDDQPLWASQDSNTRSGADTWRCKECHGWDYKGADGVYGSGSHFTGFPGVFQLAGTDPNGILAALEGSTNPDHDFSTVMDEQALTDLALFISEEIYDTTEIVNADKSPVGGNSGAGESIFSDNCTDCHGPEGLSRNFHDDAEPEYVGTIGQDNPWEFLHKAHFGQPDTDMVAGVDAGFSTQEYADLVAYVQTLPTRSLATEGGRLYDKFWEALGIDEPTGDQPLWATQDTNERSGKDTWRCKECHGWDYKGVDGVYGSGSHKTGFAGISGASSMSTEELTAWLDGTANADHDFSAYLNEDAIAMLVTFVQEGTVDSSPFINADKTVNGDPAHGEELFEECAECHGDDGQAINFGNDSEPEYVSTVANDNPWEFFHKAVNGQPGTGMISGINMGWSLQDIADILAFSQTLP